MGYKEGHKKLTALSSMKPKRSMGCLPIVEIPTLQEASMLWIVIQIAMTVKTGDQPSLPKIDAQIYATELSNTGRRGVNHKLTWPFEYTCYQYRHLIWISEQRCSVKDTNRMNGCFVSVVHNKLYCRGGYWVCVIEPEHQQELFSLPDGSTSTSDGEAIS